MGTANRLCVCGQARISAVLCRNTREMCGCFGSKFLHWAESCSRDQDEGVKGSKKIMTTELSDLCLGLQGIEAVS